MQGDMVTDIPPWGAVSIWKEANMAIDHLVSLHREALAPAAALASGIRDKLLSLYALQDELVMETCVSCSSPCCVTATVWLDFCDLLFIHLTDQNAPDFQLIEKQHESCRYHSEAGCVLPRLSRPWVCTLYFCPPQMALIRKKEDRVRKHVEETIKSIKEDRKILEEMFIRITG